MTTNKVIISYLEIPQVDMPEKKESEDTNQKLYKLNLRTLSSQLKSLVPNFMASLSEQYKDQNNELEEYSFSYSLL